MPRIAMDDGIELYVEAGPDDGKPPLLLLNALGADHTMWDGQMPRFSEHFRVVRFDDRGHGLSQAPETPYTIDRLGRDARGVLEAFGIDSAHVVGLSKGGMTAAWLGINAPEHVEKLVIVSSSPHLAPREVWEGRAQTARNEGLGALVDAVIGRWFTEPYRTGHPEECARIRAMILRASDEGYAACCEALAEMDLRDDLELIPVPTLVICGDSDPATPVAKTRDWVASIEGARLDVIRKGAHLVNVEQRDAFDELVLGFLKG